MGYTWDRKGTMAHLYIASNVRLRQVFPLHPLSRGTVPKNNFLYGHFQSEHRHRETE